MATKSMLYVGLVVTIIPMLFSFAAPTVQFSHNGGMESGTFMQAQTSGQSNQLLSLNWAGYVAYGNSNGNDHSVTSVSGSWIVQTAQSSHRPLYSAQWIGIGGYFSGDSSLIQTGTSSDSGAGGAAGYYAWYELLPAAETIIPAMTVVPGNTMEAHIYMVSGSSGSAQTWDIYLNDTSLSGTGEHFFTQVSYNSSMLSAEWIEERPSIAGSITMIANFGTANYGQQYTSVAGTNSAVIAGMSGTISAFSHTNITMVKRNLQVLVTMGPLSSDGSSFQAFYAVASPGHHGK